jgi:hypothetical protein
MWIPLQQLSGHWLCPDHASARWPLRPTEFAGAACMVWPWTLPTTGERPCRTPAPWSRVDEPDDSEEVRNEFVDEP